MKEVAPTHHIIDTAEYTREDKALFGFWVYIMSDCLLFASIFATYVVLHTSTFNGPSSRELFSLSFVLGETLLLLTSSFTYGLVSLYAHHRHSKVKVLAWMAATFLLGAGFLVMEVTEFLKLIHEGNGPWVSAFLSAFFTLLATHGLHVFFGLIWMAGLFIEIFKKGITPRTQGNISVLGLFWHFLDIIWICIFTIVYLLGVI